MCNSEQAYADALEMQPFFGSFTYDISGSCSKLIIRLELFENESVEVIVADDVIFCVDCNSGPHLCVHGALVALSLLMPKTSVDWSTKKVQKMCSTDWAYEEACEMRSLFKSIVHWISGAGSVLTVLLSTYEDESVSVVVKDDVISCAYCLSRGPLCVHGALVAMCLLVPKTPPSPVAIRPRILF